MKHRVVYFDMSIIDVAQIEKKWRREDREFLWSVIVPDIAMFAIAIALPLLAIGFIA